MASVLVIEQSSALANLLHRVLRAGGFEALTIVNELPAVPATLAAGTFRAVVLGLPQQHDEPTRTTLAQLAAAGQRALPLLILVHTPLPRLKRYAEGRGDCQVLPWQRFSRLPTLLRTMLPELDRRSRGPVGEPARSVHMLFVDDSRSARHAYRVLLEGAGFPVDVAESLTEARVKVAECRYDLVIADYYLPDGTGAELCQLLSARGDGTAVAAITGSYRESIIRECLEAGAVECMFKNEARELFLARVQAIARSIEWQRSVTAERERLDAILASVGDGVYGVDAAGRVTFINITGLELLGIPQAGAVVGRTAAKVLHGPDDEQATRRLIECYASGGRLTGFETVFRCQDGGSLPVECTIHPLSIRAARQGSVVVFRDISERKTVEQLRWEVTHDTVTGLENRRAFSQHLEQALEPLREDGGYGALLHVDMDRFTELTEAIGRQRADRVLAEIGTALASRLRQSDAIARLERDKFALLLTGLQLPNVYTIADGFRGLLSALRPEEADRELSASVGVVILSRNTPSAEYALEHARAACASAKKKGRNQTHVSVAEDDVGTARELEAGWTERFRQALRHDRFVFLAQPILRADPRLEHEDERPELLFELLLRLVGNDGHWISPGVFVPLAERIHMAQEIDLWVIRRAVALLDRFEHPRCRVCFTVNLSNLTLQDPGTLKRILAVFEGAPHAARRLVFEITETAELAGLGSARRLMQELRKRGCRFALDDFGTGFSSFSHLKHLPVDFIKIDGLFVQSMATSKVDRTVVNSITGMARALGLTTIAEHVDSEATLACARESGVDFVQGHLLGEPLVLDHLDVEDFLAPV